MQKNLILPAQNKLSNGHDLASAAVAQRMGDITVNIHTPEPSAAMQLSGSSRTHTYCTITDATLQRAVWGAGTAEAADKFMDSLGFTPSDRFVDGHPRVWYAKVPYDETSGSRSAVARDIYVKYTASVADAVLADVRAIRESKLDELEASCLPYIAILREPLGPPPDCPLTATITHGTAAAPADAPALWFSHVQYGYCYGSCVQSINPTRGPVLWKTAIPLAFKEVQVGAVTQRLAPMGCDLKVPKDPLNDKAEAIAKKANELKKELDAKEPGTTTPDILPPYATVCRFVLRRFFRSAQELDSTKTNPTETTIVQLMNNHPGDAKDSWTEKFILTGHDE
jgi:hypothetical protein